MFRSLAYDSNNLNIVSKSASEQNFACGAYINIFWHSSSDIECISTLWLDKLFQHFRYHYKAFTRPCRSPSQSVIKHSIFARSRITMRKWASGWRFNFSSTERNFTFMLLAQEYYATR